MQWYLAVLKKYVVFSGRARRKEYWMFALFNIIFNMVLNVLDVVLGLGFLGLIYGLAITLPAVGVSVRRLHDINRSGWWLLIGLVPLIGILVLIYFAIKEGDSADNRFGPNPKAGVA